MQKKKFLGRMPLDPPTLSCSYWCTQRGFTLLFPAPTLKNARMAWTAKRSLPHPCLIYTWEWGRWNNDPLYHQIWGWSKHHPYRSNAGLPVVPSVNVIYLQTRESRWSPLWKRWDYSYIARQFLSSLKMECMLILWEYSTWTFGGQSLSIASWNMLTSVW